MAFRSFSLQSATIRGVEAVPVSVEVVISNGIPGFAIVGMADAAIQESRERVKAALRSSGFVMPTEKIVVNLAPGALRKTGSGFDLPIALGILAATGQIDPEAIRDALVVGELSLGGGVRCSAGMLAYQRCAASLGLNLVAGIPDEGLIELEGLTCKLLERLSHIREPRFASAPALCLDGLRPSGDYSEVLGHEMAKRALQVAAAGGHGVIMVGPPGSGKTMLAQRFGSILPELHEQERLESALIHSVVGEDVTGILAGQRPFRSPHHSATAAGLVGGGSPPRPGEASLAHNGVLFLDELSEFKASVLQTLRQPLESGSITLTRADGAYAFPARFQFLAATNPCPCGYFGDPAGRCRCAPAAVQAYQNRIGGPLLDRIDIRIDVWRSDSRELLKREAGKSSAELREGVERARAFARRRVDAGAKGGKEKHAAPKRRLPVFSSDGRVLPFVGGNERAKRSGVGEDAASGAYYRRHRGAEAGAGGSCRRSVRPAFWRGIEMVGEPTTTEAKRIHKAHYASIPVTKLQGPRYALRRGANGYPDSLMGIPDPPKTLYVVGNLDALNDGLAVVGARKATPYGSSAAAKFAGLAAAKGVPVVSGGALGCDSQAHRGALDAGGKTVAVLGGGCDVPYPVRNASLFQEIVDKGGAVVSERDWEFPPLPYTFRARNRIIAGLARATLIVEAGLPSGTFSTADEALAANRDVLVVPGPITSPTSLGANRLIYQGATPIIDSETFEDALFGLFGCLRREDMRDATAKASVEAGPLAGMGEEDEADPLLAALCANPMRVEQMLALPWDGKGQTADKLTNIMLKLAAYERDGLVARFPDGRYGPAKV